MMTLASFIRLAKMLEVVLLPCAPATAKTCLSRKMSGKASLRESVLMPSAFAFLNSAFCAFIAAE